MSARSGRGNVREHPPLGIAVNQSLKLPLQLRRPGLKVAHRGDLAAVREPPTGDLRLAPQRIQGDQQGLQAYSDYGSECVWRGTGRQDGP